MKWVLVQSSLYVDSTIYDQLQVPKKDDEEPEATFRFWAEVTRDQVQEEMEKVFDNMKQQLKTGNDSDTVCDLMQEELRSKIAHKMEQLWLKLLHDYHMYGQSWACDGGN